MVLSLYKNPSTLLTSISFARIQRCRCSCDGDLEAELERLGKDKWTRRQLVLKPPRRRCIPLCSANNNGSFEHRLGSNRFYFDKRPTYQLTVDWSIQVIVVPIFQLFVHHELNGTV